MHFVSTRRARTERGLVLDIVAQKVARTDCRKLRESLKEALSLGALPNSRCADQDDAGCS